MQLHSISIVNTKNLSKVNKSINFMGAHRTQVRTDNYDYNSTSSNTDYNYDHKKSETNLPGQRLNWLYKETPEISREAKEIREGLNLIA